jgi:hypothetical protein
MISELKTESPLRPKMSTIAGALIVIALVVFAIGLCVNPGRANDLFWQLRTGQLILQQHRAPHFDEYSWTRDGHPWVAHEWLTFVLFRICFDWKGFGGVWLLSAALTSVITVVLYRLILGETALANVDGDRPRSESAPITACLLTAFAMIVAGAFFQPRPQLFTYLFLLITLGTVLQVRRTGRIAIGTGEVKRAERPLWFLVPIFILWANLHAGVLVGLALLAIFSIGDALVDAAEKRSTSTAGAGGRPWHRMAVVTVVCFLATLITPYSYQEYENFAATITNAPMLNGVGEWAAPDFHDPFGKLFEAFVILMLAGLFLTRLRHDPTELAFTALLAHEALTGSRNVPIFALAGVVLMARHIQSALVRMLYGKSGSNEPPSDSLFGPAPSTIIVAAVAVAIIFSGLMRTASTLKQSAPPTGSIVDRVALASIAYGDYPVRACAFIKREGFPASMRMYNTYDDGGFMIMRMPEHPVFVDSRADVYFGSMFDEVKKVTDGTLDWRTVMDAHQVDFIVSPVSETQSRGYLAAPDWALVYVDRPDIDKHPAAYDQNNTFIFIRRVPQYADLIARCRRDCPAIASGSLQRYNQYLSLR